MKHIQSFESFVNEATVKFNPKDLDQGTFFEFIDSLDAESIEGMGLNLDNLNKGYADVAKALGSNIKNVNFGDSENNNFEFFKFLTNIAMMGDAFKGKKVKILKTFDIESAWREDKNQAILVEIPGVANYVTWLDGDDYSDFDFCAYKTSDLPKIAKWAQENYEES